MRRLLALVGLILAGCAAPSPPPAPSTSPSCGQAAQIVIYHPDRLQVLNPCMTVTGVFESARPEPDGDVHMQLRLDPEFAGLLNAKNMAEQAGTLVVEPTCVGPPTQADAQDACAGTAFKPTVPPLHVHVSVTGPYVLDRAHGWAEVHPLTEWHALP